LPGRKSNLLDENCADELQDQARRSRFVAGK
jgi:hypothetical protein